MRNSNDTLPDTSLEKVFSEFYKLKRGLEEHPDDETYTDHATVMLVSVVENMCRVKMLPKVGTKGYAKPESIFVRVSLLTDTARKNGHDWALPDRDHEKAVREFLESVNAKECGGLVQLSVTAIDRFVEDVCGKPKPYLKNDILASSYSFQRTKRIKGEFGDGLFDGTGYSESDYYGMFGARHALVHSMVREPDMPVHRRVDMVEKLLERLLGDVPGAFNHHRGAALMDDDPKTALKCLSAAACQDPDAWTLYRLGCVQCRLGNVAEAKRTFLEAARRIGGLRKEMEGRLAHADNAAADWFRQDMGILAVGMGEEMRRIGEEDSASACFAAAASISGESDADMCVCAAWHQRGVGRFEEAVRCLDLALASKDMGDGKRSILYCDKGDMLSFLDGRAAESRECFEWALEMDAGNAEARRRLSELPKR